MNKKLMFQFNKKSETKLYVKQLNLNDSSSSNRAGRISKNSLAGVAYFVISEGGNRTK